MCIFIGCRGAIVTVGIVVALLLAIPAWADTVTLKNGRQVEGLVRELPGRNQIDVIMPGTRITFNKNDLTTYTLDTKAINFLISAEIAAGEGNQAQAWQYYLYAMDEEAPLERIKSSVLKYRQRIFPYEDEQEISNRSMLREFCNRLRRYGQSDDELLALCAKALFVVDDYQGALDAYTTISIYYYTNHPEEKDFVVTLIQKEIGEDIAMGRFQLALQKAEIFASIEPLVAESCKVLAYLNWAGEEKREGNYEESLRICRDEIHPIAPTIARDRVIKLIDMIKARTTESDEYTTALKVINEYALTVAPDAARGFLLVMIEEAVDKALAARDWQRAQAYFEFAPEDMLDKALRPSLDRVEFHQRWSALAEDDVNAQFKLGEWAMSRGLLPEAVLAYEKAVVADHLRDDAQLQIQLIQRQQQTDQFRIILSLYESGNFSGTLHRTEIFLQEFPRGQYTAELNQLVELTQQRIASEAGKRPLMAEVAFQQAERSYLLGEYGDALRHLDRIDKMYSDTPAADKGLQLKIRVLRAIEMARLENLYDTRPRQEVPLDRLTMPEPGPSLSNIQDEMQNILDKLNAYKQQEN